ncbi:Bug family tripartite tricarboxylate transporter substrate binding protein [Plastoroseomonas arctica]|uniref:Tripartite tricarboxylate transporter substrate binding protein n=1 Tax=Plastoroseomonas arctica TaxID=1509237 RepID=A0AAF1K010_9PROT|nr:tripartite tricarboxylate transporter substrate binding protein [Plastoroseomonas arctica]MBR0656318.1 tripartite tricarboxylate transporter substrate binding protein [Plastoroseomonas arctica]
MPDHPTRRGLLIATVGLGLAAPALADQTPGWPSQNLRLVVPFTPGGSNDAFARPVAEALQTALGRPVVVDNRPGAAGSIGAGFVAAAPPDGHTLLLASSSFATSSTIRRTPFDALESFDAIQRLCTAPMVVVTKPNSPFRTMDQLVAQARAEPRTLLYGMAGLGGIGHFAMESFNLASRLQMEAIPYSGIAPAQADLVSGRIDFLMTTLASVRGLVEANTVPVIAVSTAARVPDMPQVPTIRESTGIDYEVEVWWGILAPRGVPAAVQQRLNAEIARAVQAPSYLRFLEAEGARPAPLDLPGFRDALRTDVLRWRRVAADARITVN